MKRKRKALTRGQRLWGWTKFIAFLWVLVAALLIGGFIEFARQVDTQTEPPSIPDADGIVVWTGPGGGRLRAGAALLEGGHGERLLISGVNEQNSAEDVRAVLGVTEDQQACCLDLDYAAIDTTGNARETASWAEALGYEHIILVTSDYHMPRAQIEIANARAALRVTPFPVMSGQGQPWWKNRARFDRLTREYGKLLRTLLRSPRGHNTDRANALPIPDEAAQTAPEPSSEPSPDPSLPQP